MIEIQSLINEKERIEKSGEDLKNQLLLAWELNPRFRRMDFDAFIASEHKYQQKVSRMCFDYMENIHNPILLINSRINYLRMCLEGKDLYIPEPKGLDREFFYSLTSK